MLVIKATTYVPRLAAFVSGLFVCVPRGGGTNIISGTLVSCLVLSVLAKEI